MSRKHTNTKRAARRPAFSKQQKESSALKNLICNTFLLVMFTVFPLFVTLAWQDSFPCLVGAYCFLVRTCAKYPCARVPRSFPSC